MSKFLIVDDDVIFCTQLRLYITRLGHECDITGSLSDGIDQANAENYDLVFLDIVLPDASGLEGIDDFRKTEAMPEVIIITGQGNSQGPEIALKNGAWDYIEKPPAYAKIKLLVTRALQFRKKKLLFRQKPLQNRDALIGSSKKFKESLELVAMAAGSEGNVFVTGETGTGKELIAKAIHQNSARVHGRFVPVDCTNIPTNLAENILFGHKKGTYTGANRDEEGLIFQANKGTLFFDEIGDLDEPIQKMLLRVLQEKKYRPLGGKKEIACDVRVISASNKDLKHLVEKKEFRKDLYYRLVAFHIPLPPLRSRTDDVKPLVKHYVHSICRELAIAPKGVSSDFIDTLKGYAWPGNIRELINILRSAIANAFDDGKLYPHYLPMDFRINVIKKNIGSRDLQKNNSPVQLQLKEMSHENFLPFKQVREQAVSQLEHDYLEQLSRLSAGNITNACRLCGISRARLYQLLKKHGIVLKKKATSPAIN